MSAWGARGAVFLFALSLGGCAAVFRDSRVPVRVDSDPEGAEIVYDERAIGVTPMRPELERNASTALRISKPGYQVHRGAVPKHLNAGWAVADIATCVIPIALCIPLLVDAISGAWMDVDESYRATLEPLAPGAIVIPGPGAAPPGSPSGTPNVPPPTPSAPTPVPGQIDL